MIFAKWRSETGSCVVFQCLPEMSLIGPLITLEHGLSILPAVELAEHLQRLVHEIGGELPPQGMPAPATLRLQPGKRPCPRPPRAGLRNAPVPLGQGRESGQPTGAPTPTASGLRSVPRRATRRAPPRWRGSSPTRRAVAVAGVRGGAAPRQPPQGTREAWPQGACWLTRLSAARSRNVDSHCPGRGLPAFRASRRSLIVRSAASVNVGTPRPCRSWPWRTSRLLSSTFRRASAKVTSGYGPSPIEVGRPSILTR